MYYFFSPRRAYSCAVTLLSSVLLLGPFSGASAQSASAGKILYTSVLVAGNRSCSDAQCHTANPALRQNKIQNGTVPGNISAATASVSEMKFLDKKLTTQNLNDLAAYIANPAAATGSPVAQLTATALSFGSSTIGTAAAAQTVTLSNSGTAVLNLAGISTASSEFTVSGGTCGASGSVPVGGSCTITVTFTPIAAGARAATLTVTHNATPATSSVSLTGTGTASVPIGGTTKVMTEYRYIPLAYYFITSRDSDKAALDAVPGFERTGQSFNVFATQQPNTQGVSRFYFDKVALAGARGSHFYTLVNAEKSALLSLNPTNTQLPKLPFDEGIDSYAYLPLVEGVGGSCAAGQTPVYRIFRGNARFPDDPNHRFTTSTVIYNDFVAQGWDGEGVKFCVPQ